MRRRHKKKWKTIVTSRQTTYAWSGACGCGERASCLCGRICDGLRFKTKKDKTTFLLQPILHNVEFFVQKKRLLGAMMRKWFLSLNSAEKRHQIRNNQWRKEKQKKIESRRINQSITYKSLLIMFNASFLWQNFIAHNCHSHNTTNDQQNNDDKLFDKLWNLSWLHVLNCQRSEITRQRKHQDDKLESLREACVHLHKKKFIYLEEDLRLRRRRRERP